MSAGWHAWAVEPSDTLFFRDGRPFHQDDEGLAEARSVFPPYPPTMVGAFRAAFARSLGWRDGPRSNWTDLIAAPGAATGDPAEKLRQRRLAALGDGPRCLGQMRFRGPLLAETVNGELQMLFPCPSALMGSRSRGENGDNGIGALRLLRPRAAMRLRSDIVPGDRIALCTPGAETKEKFAPLTRYWISRNGLLSFLEGNLPIADHVKVQSQLWNEQRRIGFERDGAAHTAVEGRLYAAAHNRLREGILLVFGAAAGEEELLSGWEPYNPLILGGEARTAHARKVALDLSLGDFAKREMPAAEGGKLRYTVVLLAPAELKDGWRRPGGALPNLPGCVVSAVVDRPDRIGGWNALGEGSAATQACAPAGSVWFMEAEADERLPAEPVGIGERTKEGFGLALIGRWPESQEEGKSP